MANSAILGQNSPKIIIIIIIKMQNYYFGDIICTPHHLIAITGLDKTSSSPFANSLHCDSCSVSVGVGTPLIARL